MILPILNFCTSKFDEKYIVSSIQHLTAIHTIRVKYIVTWCWMLAMCVGIELDLEAFCH